jgi:hypothetical protein
MIGLRTAATNGHIVCSRVICDHGVVMLMPLAIIPYRLPDISGSPTIRDIWKKQEEWTKE